MTPDDFKLTVMEEAWRLRRSALARSATHTLDERTAIWVIRMDAWRELKMSADYVNSISIGVGRRKELMGLPVRVTIDDEPDVPMIQLVMEPEMFRP